MDPEPAKTSSESYGKTKEDLVSRDMVKALTQDTFLPPPVLITPNSSVSHNQSQKAILIQIGLRRMRYAVGAL